MGNLEIVSNAGEVTFILLGNENGKIVQVPELWNIVLQEAE